MKRVKDDGSRRRRKEFRIFGTWGNNPCRSDRKVGTLSVDEIQDLGKEVPVLSWKTSRRRVGCWNEESDTSVSAV